ncbi:MAG TPA: PilZ domain-containing protein, partial [Dissulfurispiraceae bacterium]|nr:PilZ domain-containing protein [Dissulfurispiraceae bacterium]
KAPGACLGPDGRGFSGTVIELGPRGFSATAKDAFVVEDKLPVFIHLNWGHEQASISATAQIRWTKKLDNGDGFQYGFEFVHMDEALRRALHNYLYKLREKDPKPSEVPFKILPEEGLLQTLTSDSGYIDIKGAKNKAQRA